MPRVVLLRHAQASLHGPSYDQLSDLGFEQSAALGQHLRQQPWHPSLFCVGPAKRHQQTAQTILQAGNTWGEPTNHRALDELQAEEIIAAAIPILLANPDAHPSVAEALSAETRSERTVKVVTNAAFTLWMADALDGWPGESWRDFRRRVFETLNGLVLHARPNQPSVAVTSAGFIATAIGLVAGYTDAETRQQIRRVPNASVTVLQRHAHRPEWTVVSMPDDDYLALENRTWI